MGSTTARGYPYPVGTDRVMDGDDAIKALAEKVDVQLGVTACGLTSITLNAVSSATVAVTLPAGRFASPPTQVSVTPVAVSVFIASVGTLNSATSFNLTLRQYANTATTATVSVCWFAAS